MQRKCGWCEQLKEVYGYQEIDYEEVKDVPIAELLVEGKAPLKDDDVVGVPICKECYRENRGEV